MSLQAIVVAVDEALDPLLRRYLGPVLRDLRATTDLELEFRTEHPALAPAEAQFFKDVTWIVIDGDVAGGMGPGGYDVLDGEGPSWPVVLQVTENFHEVIIENAMNTWPDCPAHRRHPMWPRVDPELPEEDYDITCAEPHVVVWSCLYDPTVRFKVGTLVASR